MNSVYYGQSTETALRDIEQERGRQVIEEGFGPAHDNQWRHGQLALAAACYAYHGARAQCTEYPPAYWPWDLDWWKPTDKRRSLVKAAALIVAEIERLDREASE